MTVLLVLLLAAVALGAIFAGVPVYLALGGGALAAAVVGAAAGGFDANLLGAIPIRLMGIATSDTLAAIPFFIAIGTLLDRSGIAADMVGLLGRSRSARALPLAALVVAVLLAASTGVVGATIVLLASVALPGMLSAGLPQGRSAGLLAASGTLGQIIPPSILLVLLSDQLSNAWLESQRQIGVFAASPITVGELFAACLVPGLLLAALYAVYVLFAFPGGRSPNVPDRAPRVSAIGVLAPFALIVLVLGSILAGVATPTEAASCGAAGALVLALLRAPGSVNAGLGDAARLTGAIFAIVIAASIVALVLRGLGADDAIAGLLSGQAAHGALVTVMVAIFLLGFVIEFVEIVFIVIPIAAPPLLAAGIDPIWFAALVAMNLQTSFLTPPFGLSLFYLRAAAPQVPFATLVRGVVPFILLQLLALGLVALVPALATWLPALLFSTPGG